MKIFFKLFSSANCICKIRSQNQQISLKSDKCLIFNSGNKNLMLRGGGCGSSIFGCRSQLEPEIDTTVVIESESNVNCQNFEKINNAVQVISEGHKNLLDNFKRNELIQNINRIFQYREFLNQLCIQGDLYKKYNKATENFKILLEVLPSYLQVSWYFCYQIVQICNEFLRVIYANNKIEKISEQLREESLEQIRNFSEQLKSESGQIWKTGIEFEITIMEIMLVHSNTDSEVEKEQVIDLIKNIGKSVLKMKITGKLISSLKKSAKIVLNKGKDMILYPIEIYQVYHSFQTLKWSIIQNIKNDMLVTHQIQHLKSLFSQYIQNSKNWLLHFCWISIIIDLLTYRPIIYKNRLLLVGQNQFVEPQKQQQLWNKLVNSNLIKSMQCSNEEAKLILIDDYENFSDSDINSFLKINQKKSYSQLCKYIQRGEFFEQKIHFWEYYQKFDFQKDQQEQKDYELILNNISIEIVERQLKQFQNLIDEIQSLDSQMQDTFASYYEQEQVIDQFNLELTKNDLMKQQSKFLEAWIKGIVVYQTINEFSNFEFEKIKLLQTQKKEGELSEQFGQIEKFITINMPTFETCFIQQFLEDVKYLANLKFITLNLQNIKKEIYQNTLSIFKRDSLTKLKLEEFSVFTQDIYLYLEEFQSNCLDLTQEKIDIKENQFETLFKLNFEDLFTKKVINQLQEQFQNSFPFSQNEEKLEQQNIQCIYWIEIFRFLKLSINNSQLKQEIFINTIIQFQNQSKSEKVVENNYIIQKMLNVLKSQSAKTINYLEKLASESNAQQLQKEFKQYIYLELEQIITDLKKELQNLQSLARKSVKNCLCLLQTVQIELIQTLHKISYNSQLQKFENKDGWQNQFNFSERFNKQIDILQEILDEQIKEDKVQNKEEGQQDIQLFFLKFKEQNQFLLQSIKSVSMFLKSYQKQILTFSEIQSFSFESDREDIEQQKSSIIDENKTLLKQIQHFYQLHKPKIIELQNNLLQLIEMEDRSNKIKIVLALNQFLTVYDVKVEDEQENQNEEISNNVFTQLWSDIQDYYKKRKYQVEDTLEAKDYKVREFYFFNLLRIQQSNLEESLVLFSTKLIQDMWLFERDQRVRSLMKNKELIQMQKQFFQNNLPTLQDQIKNEMKKRINLIENLQQQIRLQSISKEREQLQIQLELSYQELDESLDNVQEMSQAMDVSLIFLKDISKDVKQIKTQIENLQNSLNQVGDDVRKLRGKKYSELLEMRKLRIFSLAEQAEVDSIYVELITKERDPVSGKVQDGSFLLKSDPKDKDGEVNEFIWLEDDKDVMLLSGFAGSGKSRAARKIEEYIWKQQNYEPYWIPIYVSLPTLKNPKYNLLEQALESENYQFDKYQIKEFKEAIQNQKERIVLILDSYDEMKQECIQQNLILTNKLYQDLNVNDDKKQLKVIITSRREILTNDGYESWFYGKNIQSFKEVQLLNFDEDQQRNYLTQYCELSVKRLIRGMFEFIKSFQQKRAEMAEFLKIWNSISGVVRQSISNSNEKLQDVIFRPQQEEPIIKKLKMQSIFQFLTQEQIISLRKELLSLWNVNKFLNTIETVNVKHLLTTPFMLEIIVQVLPSMKKKYQGSNSIKELFKQNFIQILKRVKLSDKNIKKMEEQKKKEKFEVDQTQKSKSQINTKNKKIKQIKKEKQYEIIVDQLDQSNFFQNYSIDSVLSCEENSIILDGTKMQLDSNHIEVVLRALEMKKFTAFEFYETFVNFYHEQQIYKLRELGRIQNYESFALDIHQFSLSLALDMTFRELSQISYKQKGQLILSSNYKATLEIDNWLDQYLSDSSIDKEYKQLVRSCSLLSNKGSNYSFTHKSIQEFYVSQYLFNFLNSLSDFSLDENLSRNPQENLERLANSLFNSQSFNITIESFRGACSFLKEKLQVVENINYKLINMVLLSRNAQFSPVASNSIFLLNMLDVYLGEKDFNSIQLANTSISGLSFFQSNLSNSKLKNVAIDSCNFNHSNLSDIEWFDIGCKEKPHLKLEQEVIIIRISQDGRFFLSVTKPPEEASRFLNLLFDQPELPEKEQKKKYIIQIWEFHSYQLISNIHEDENQITDVQFSNDSSLLMASNKEGQIFQWSIQADKEIELITVFHTQIEILKFKISQDNQKLYIFSNNNFLHIGYLEFLNNINDVVYYNPKLNQSEQVISHFVFSPDGSNIALVCNDFTTILFHIQTQQDKIIDIQDSKIKAVQFNSEGNFLLIYSSKIITVFVLSSSSEIFEKIILVNDFLFNYLSFSPDNKSIIISGNSVVKQLDLFQKERLSYKLEQFSELEVCYITGIAAVIIDKCIFLINLQTKMKKLLQKFDFEPKDIRFSMNGEKIALFEKDENKKVIQLLIITITSSEVISIKQSNGCWNLHLLTKNFDQLIFQSQPMYMFQSYHILKCDILELKNQQLSKELHLDQIEILDFKPYSTFVVYKEKENNQITLINFETDEQIENDLLFSKLNIKKFCFSTIYQSIIIGTSEGELYNWNFDQKFVKLVTKIPFVTYELCMSPNDSYLAAYTQTEIYFIQMKNYKILKKDSLSIENSSLAFSFDSKIYAFQQSCLGPIQLKYFDDDEDVVIENEGGNWSYCFSSVENILLVAKSEEFILNIWDISNKKILVSKKLDFKIYSIKFSQNGNFIVMIPQSIILGDRIVHLWKYQNNTLEIIGSQIFYEEIIYAQFVKKDEQDQILFYFKNTTLVQCPLSNFFFKNYLQEKYDFGQISHNDEFIAFIGYGGIFIYDQTSFELLLNIENQNVNSIQFLASSPLIAFTVNINYQNVEIQFWNIQQKQLTFRQTFFRLNYYSIQLEFDNNYLIFQNTQQDKKLYCWKIIKNFEQEIIQLKQCGYYEDIVFKAFGHNSENFFGLNESSIALYELNNVEFCFEMSEEHQIKKVFSTPCLQYYYILNNEKFFIYNRKTQLLSVLEYEVFNTTYNSKYSLLALANESEIFIVHAQEDSFTLRHTIKFGFSKYSDENMAFTKDGNNFFFQQYHQLRWCSLTENTPLLGYIELEQSNVQVSDMNTLCILENENNSNRNNKLKVIKASNLKFFVSIRFFKKEDNMLFQFNQDETIIYSYSNEEIKMYYIEKFYCNHIKFQTYQYLLYAKYIDDKSFFVIKLVDKESKFILVSINADQNGQLTASEQDIGVTKTEINNFSLYSSNSLLAISNKTQNNIDLWNIQSKKIIGVLKGHGECINELCFSQDGSILISASKNGLIKLWNVQISQSFDSQYGHKGNVTTIVFSPDDLLVASGSQDGTIILWDLNENKFIKQFEAHDYEVNALLFSLDSKRLITSGGDKKLKFWITEFPYNKESPEFVLHVNHTILYMNWNYLGNYLTTSGKELIQSYDISTFKKYKFQSSIFIQTPQEGQSCFSFGDQFIFQDFHGNNKDDFKSYLKLLDIKTQKIKVMDQLKIRSIACSQMNAKQFLVVEEKSQISNSLLIYHTDLGKLRSFNYFPYALKITLSPNDKYLLSQSKQILKLWDFNLMKSQNEDFQINILELNKLFTDYDQIINVSHDLEFVSVRKGDQIYLISLNQQKNKNQRIFNYSSNDTKFSYDSKYLAALIYYSNEIAIFNIDQKNTCDPIFLYREGWIVVWNLEQNQYKIIFSETLNYATQTIILSSNQQVIQSNGNSITIFKTNSPPKELNIDIDYFAISSNEIFIAIGKNDSLTIRQVENLNQISASITLYIKQAISYISFSNNDGLMLVCQSQYFISLFALVNNNWQIVGLWGNAENEKCQINLDFSKVCVINRKNLHFIELSKSLIDISELNERVIKGEVKISSFSLDSKLLAFLQPQLVLFQLETLEKFEFNNIKGDQLQFTVIDQTITLIIQNYNVLNLYKVSNLQTVECIMQLHAEKQIVNFQFTEQYFLFSQGWDWKLKLIRTAEIFENLQEYEYFYDIQISKNNEYLALIRKNFSDESCKTQIVYTKFLPQILFSIKDNTVLNMRFSSNNEIIILLYKECILIQDLTQQVRLSSLQFDYYVNGGVISQSSKKIAIHNYGKVIIFYINSEFQIIEECKLHDKDWEFDIINLNFHGSLLISQMTRLNHIYLVLWDLERQAVIAIKEHLGPPVKVIEFCPSECRFVVGLEDGSVNLYLIQNSFSQNENQLTMQCYKSISRQPILEAQGCILNEQSQIKSKNLEIKNLFLQKGAILYKNIAQQNQDQAQQDELQKDQ